MKKSLLLSLFVAATFASTSAFAADFGAPIPEGDATPIATAEPTGTPALYSGRITEVCQQQGCWMVLEQDGQSARVMMKDHAFTIPKDSTGDAIAYGVLEVVPVDAEEAAHLAEDGANAPAERELRIVATAVRIL